MHKNTLLVQTKTKKKKRIKRRPKLRSSTKKGTLQPPSPDSSISSLDLEDKPAPEQQPSVVGSPGSHDSYANCRSMLPAASVGEVEVRGFTLGTAADCLGLRHVDSIDEPDFRTACALADGSLIFDDNADRRTIGKH